MTTFFFLFLFNGGSDSALLTLLVAQRLALCASAESKKVAVLESYGTGGKMVPGRFLLNFY